MSANIGPVTQGKGKKILGNERNTSPGHQGEYRAGRQTERRSNASGGTTSSSAHAETKSAVILHACPFTHLCRLKVVSSGHQQRRHSVDPALEVAKMNPHKHLCGILNCISTFRFILKILSYFLKISTLFVKL